MIVVDNNRFGFHTRTIWFSEKPYDVDDVDGVAFLSCKNKLDMPGFAREERSTIVIDLKEDLDTIWKNMDPSCRKDIKKAEKEGFTVQMNKNYEAFLELHDRLRQAKGLPPNQLSIDFMKKYGALFSFESQGSLVGGCFVLVDTLDMLAMIAATRRLEVPESVRPFIASGNRLMNWEIIKFGKEKGVEAFDQGGFYTGSNPNTELEKINTFKKRFGGTVRGDYMYFKDYSSGIKIARAGARFVDRVRGHVPRARHPFGHATT